MDRMRSLVKDHRVLDLIERITRGGILIGAYFSQWFANTTLQPLDHAIRESGLKISHYLRYIDNFTIFAGSKRALGKAIKSVSAWLKKRGMALKGNWQKFRTSIRLPDALGYRYGRGYTLLRKRNLLRLTRQCRRIRRRQEEGAQVPYRSAAGLLSRIGQLCHCSSTGVMRRIYRKGTQRKLKNIIREHARREQKRWNMYSDWTMYAVSAHC